MGRMVEVGQFVPAPADQVFAAWTTSDGIARWWWPHIPDTRYDIDAREGGSYRIISDAVGIGVEGEFVRIRQDQDIVMSWRWLTNGVSAVEEVVWVGFGPKRGGTNVSVSHHLDDLAGDGDNIRQGWVDVLARLGSLPWSGTTG